jgi:hypothetical protein
MRTIHIDRLDLTCRGISPELAQAALSELGPALVRRLGGGGGSDDSESDVVRVSGKVGPEALADRIAGRVSSAMQNNRSLGQPII